jgi:2-oxoglutarate/2-oxoacid ferredoxin oxidoreductase subunit beta
VSAPCAPPCALDRLGHGMAAAFARQSGRDSRRHVVTSGGCAAFVAGWVEGTLHRVPLGRSIPFALGLSQALPGHDVFVFLGDGEAAGVGGHHLSNAARRGDRVRALIVNNEVLGGTGGFPSPTTPRGGRTAFQPAGSAPRALDVAELARAAGAAWVGRETVTAGDPLIHLLAEFVGAPPFAVLEVRAPCYPAYGQWNGFPTPEEMHAALERRALRGGTSPGGRADAESPDTDRFRVGRLWPGRVSAS